jgi:hypothetical protein
MEATTGDRDLAFNYVVLDPVDMAILSVLFYDSESGAEEGAASLRRGYCCSTRSWGLG